MIWISNVINLFFPQIAHNMFTEASKEPFEDWNQQICITFSFSKLFIKYLSVAWHKATFYAFLPSHDIQHLFLFVMADGLDIQMSIIFSNQPLLISITLLLNLKLTTAGQE